MKRETELFYNGPAFGNDLQMRCIVEEQNDI